MPFHTVIKRDGTEVPFKIEKISNAIEKAFIADGGKLEHNSQELADAVVLFLEKNQVVKPPIEEIQDMVEVVLANLGYARVAQKYKAFREERRLARGRLFVEGVNPEDYEEIHSPIMVENIKKQISSKWDLQIIQQKLIEDFQLPTEIARTIASAVEKKIISLEFNKVSSELIREFTNNILPDYGYGHLVLKDVRIGMPLGDIEQLFQRPKHDFELNNPEKIRATIATHSLKQFSLQNIFSKESAFAHASGRMHIHGLGHPCALASGVISVRQIAFEGLQLMGLKTKSKPARHAKVLTTHINTYLSCMRPYYYGPISLSYLNVFYAPYLENLSTQEIYQEAQNLIYISSQNAYARGGEPLAIDFNIYSYMPEEIKMVVAVGPGGKLTGKTYGEYSGLAMTFANALLDCWDQGDAFKNAFDFPIATLHYQKDFKSNISANDFLKKASQIAVRRKNINFIKDHKHTGYFSSQTHLQDSMLSTTSRNSSIVRMNNLQTISINLPHLLLRRGLKSKDSVLSNLESELNSILSIALQAHEEKRNFLLALGSQKNSPLVEIFKIMPDGFSLVDLRTIKSCIGFVGLSEFTEMAVGESFYQGNLGFNFAKDFLALFHTCLHNAGLFSDLYEIEENPELVASYRLARRDAEKFLEASKYFDSLQNGGVHYSNSYLPKVDSDISLERQYQIQTEFNEKLGLHCSVLKVQKVGVTWEEVFQLL